MLLKALMCGAVLGCGLLALVGVHHPGKACPGARLLALVCASSADAEKNNKDRATLSGVWVQDGGEMKIEFPGKDVMKLFPHGENKAAIIVCRYTVAKKGLVKVTITELEGKAKQKLEKVLPVGLEFSFRWTVQDSSGTLDEVKGEKVEPLKSHLEGKYRRQKR
jgi:hypothetical protein